MLWYFILDATNAIRGKSSQTSKFQLMQCLASLFLLWWIRSSTAISTSLKHHQQTNDLRLMRIFHRHTVMPLVNCLFIHVVNYRANQRFMYTVQKVWFAIFWGSGSPKMGPVSPKFELGRDLTVHLSQVSSSRQMYKHTNTFTKKDIQLKASTLLHCSTLLEDHYYRVAQKIWHVFVSFNFTKY